MRDDIVSQHLGFGRWNFFISVTNGHVFLTFPFPVPLAQGSTDVPEKIVRFYWLQHFKSCASQKYRVVEHYTFLLARVPCKHSIDCDKNIMQEYSTHQ